MDDFDRSWARLLYLDQLQTVVGADWYRVTGMTNEYHGLSVWQLYAPFMGRHDTMSKRWTVPLISHGYI